MTSSAANRLTAARREVQEAHARFNSDLDALQGRLKPKALVDHAWSEVREKSGEIADEAIQAVKDRPVAASGLVVAFLLFLGREPILSAASKLLSRKESRGGTKSKPKGK